MPPATFSADAAPVNSGVPDEMGEGVWDGFTVPFPPEPEEWVGWTLRVPGTGLEEAIGRPDEDTRRPLQMPLLQVL